MTDIAIRVENLSKLYHIGAAQERHDSLRDAAASLFRRRPAPRAPRPSDTALWALKDVSFEVKQGEVVGVIGRNGAGKSTLLKILSRITEPTSGRVTLHGRVASLLEVGTGFHPELSGRENIYLNGAILGMKRCEIDRKFDEIVAFAEIERFLNTPVKRYSSGMYVRLAFAVAAHLEPEILLVDEVLAVGDAAFQKKCLGKMGNVAEQGRTVLFVSHNMGAISQLCPRSLHIAKGSIAQNGQTDSVISTYLGNWVEIRGPLWGIADSNEVNQSVVVKSVNCQPSSVFMGDDVVVKIEYDVVGIEKGLMFGISVETTLGQRVFGSYMGREGFCTGEVSGRQWARISLLKIPLVPGIYDISVTVHESNGENLVRVERACSLEILPRDVAQFGYLVDSRSGLVWLEHSWELSRHSRETRI